MSSSVNAVGTQVNVTRIKEMIYDFTWIVENLNLDVPLKGDHIITSPAFQIDCKPYQLQLFPDGINTHRLKNYVLLDIPKKLDLKNYTSEICLVNKNGDEDFSSSFELAFKSSCYLVERSKITSDFLPNGQLTIKWKLHRYVNEDLIQSLRLPSIENMAEKRRLAELDDFEKLLNNDRFSDIKIVIDNQKFFVHKNILAARSRYFAAMFESNMKEEKEGKIRISNISANIMQEILCFIYTGKLNVEETNIIDLLMVADMYGLDGLIRICEEAIISNYMNLENIGSILTVINRLNNVEKLKDSAIEYLAKNANELSGNESFRKALKSLSTSFMAEIIPAMMSKL